MNRGMDQIGNKTRSQWYCATITLPEAVGANVAVDIRVTLEKYIAQGLMWDQGLAVWNEIDPGPPPVINVAAGLTIIRDGLFTIEMRTSSRIYQNQPVMIRAFAGDSPGGRFVPFPTPIPIDAKETFQITLVNLLDRTGLSPDLRRVDIAIVGISQV